MIFISFLLTMVSIILFSLRRILKCDRKDRERVLFRVHKYTLLVNLKTAMTGFVVSESHRSIISFPQVSTNISMNFKEYVGTYWQRGERFRGIEIEKFRPDIGLFLCAHAYL